MNRLVTRPEFTGPVEPGNSYVLVDDVVTLEGTLAEAANYIESKGGKVAGAIVLANASRTGTLAPKAKTIQTLEERYGEEIRELFGVEPAALTAPEATYLAGFKSAESLRNRAAAARQENRSRGTARAEGKARESQSQGPSFELLERPQQLGFTRRFRRAATNLASAPCAWR